MGGISRFFSQRNYLDNLADVVAVVSHELGRCNGYRLRCWYLQIMSNQLIDQQTEKRLLAVLPDDLDQFTRWNV